jgi:hypothetical protein
MAQVPSNLIPISITNLPVPVTLPSEDTLLVGVYQGVTYKIRAGDLLQVAGVPTSRQVIAGTSLTGGGALSSNVTLSVAPKGIGTAQLADSGVTPGVYGDGTNVPQVTVDATGRVMAATSVPISISGYVPTSREVIAGNGLTGGGPLSSNVTLAVNYGGTPLAGSGSGSAGTALTLSRSDHRHPAVDLADQTQIDGILPIDQGGTGRSLVMQPGGMIWSGSDGLYVGPAGVSGQVLVSGGTGAPTWGSTVILAPVTAHYFFAGPSSGPAADPTFRAIVNGDLPGLGEVTYNGVSVALGGSGTITAVNPYALTIGTGLSGTSYDGSAAVTIANTGVLSWSGGTTGLTPATATTGAVTLAGTLAIANGGTGATTAAGAPFALKGANSDITSMSGITGGVATPDYIDFHTGAVVTSAVGRIFWDGGTTLNVGMTANVAGKVNEDQFYYIKASSAITKGQVIMFTGAVGASGVVTGAPATGVTDGSYIMGVAAEDIALNGFGLVQVAGTLRGLDTSAFTDGAVLWYNPAVTGGLTATKPSAPNIKVQIAAVVNAGNGGSGSILIRVSAGSVLGGTDSNVQFGTLANNDLIQYSTSLGYWHNIQPSALTGVGSLANALTIGTGLSGTSYNGSSAITIAIDSTVATLSGSQTLTNKTISGASNTLSNIGNSSLTNSSVTFNGVTVALGASGTITAANPAALTLGSYLTGTSYDGSAAVTAAVDATSTNTASKVVARDASGNFAAGTITAALSGNATSATNLAGGAASQIPYQSAAGTTAFIANGTAGQVLKSNGASAPSWGDISGGTF